MSWIYANWPYLLIFLGVLLSAVGGLGASFGQAKFERDLREKSEQSLQRTEEAIKSITGGDTIVFARPTRWEDDQVTYWLDLECEGKYPAYDIEIQLEDISKRMTLLTSIEEVKRIGAGRLLDEMVTSLQVGNMRPGTSRR